MRDFYIKLFFIFWVLNVFGQENYSIQLPEVDYQNPMVFIQGGEFIMGSPKVEGGHFGDEGPQHRVTIAPFWMSKVEITWDLYNLFVSREIDQNQIIKDANKDVDVNEYALRAAGARDTEYIPDGGSELVYTKMLGGGESDTITFDAPEPGTYIFICSFPGHYQLMMGEFIVS